MRLRVPEYYKDFHCIADKCKDSCCVGWEIDIDEDTYEYYQTIDGEFGKRLKKNMKAGKDNCFTLKHGRCPFLNKTNLCDIVLELGEEALCEVCTEYPRFTMEYGDVIEKCMALSCEEVGRLVFQSAKPFTYEEKEEEDSYCFGWDGIVGESQDHEIQFDEDMEFDSDGFGSREDELRNCDFESLDGSYDSEDDMEDEPSKELIEALEKARDTCFRILSKRNRPIEERVVSMLEYIEKIQTLVNDNEYDKIVELTRNDTDALVSQTHKEWCSQEDNHQSQTTAQEDFEERMNKFHDLEVLDDEWRRVYKQTITELSHSNITNEDYEQKLNGFMEFYRDREYEYEHILNYFIFRYFMRSVYDYDVIGKAKLAVVSWLCVRDLDLVRYEKQEEKFTLEDRIDIARIYSKEIEHCDDNVNTMEEMFHFEDVFTTNHLIRQCRIIPRNQNAMDDVLCLGNE